MKVVESGVREKGKIKIVTKIAECNLSYAQFIPRTSFIFLLLDINSSSSRGCGFVDKIEES